MASLWTTELNALTTRSELVDQYGGSKYSGGVVPADASGNVFLFSDPTVSGKYGYNFDGPGEDGCYYYTGQGSLGDHSENGANGSVLGHAAAQRTLRLFVAEGFIDTSKTKLQRYLGQYRIDPFAPFTRQSAPDSHGVVRTVLVFRLLPVGETVLSTLKPDDPEIPSLTTARMVPPEVDSTLYYESSGSMPTTAEKTENRLVADFRTWLAVPSYAIKRWAIRVEGTSSPLLSDIYNSNTHTLYEAKSSSGRRDVRMAVGQLLDYQRHIPISDLRCSLLLPAKPSNDLIDLAHFARMDVTFKMEDGGFHRLAS